MENKKKSGENILSFSLCRLFSTNGLHGKVLHWRVIMSQDAFQNQQACPESENRHSFRQTANRVEQEQDNIQTGSS